ncbi:MAG TPA: hypothetical protein VNH83_28155 [Bryobacteraceae bacterium]|nr:hypothetical protein [Bryobacteraceae bacterium]
MASSGFALSPDVINAAAYRGDKDALFRALNACYQGIETISQEIGVSPGVSNAPTSSGSGSSQGAPQTMPSPPNPQFVVTAYQGLFSVQIAVPQELVDRTAQPLGTASQPLPLGKPATPVNLVSSARQRYRRILYEVQYATDANYDAGGGVNKLGPDDSLFFVVPVLPGSYFVRVRARYQNSSPTPWVAIAAPIIIPSLGTVASGLGEGLTTDALLFTFPAVQGGYQIGGYISLQSVAAGSIRVQLAYTDPRGVARTQVFRLMDDTGADGVSASVAGAYSILVGGIAAASGDITLSVIGTGFAGEYDAFGWLVQVG